MYLLIWKTKDIALEIRANSKFGEEIEVHLPLSLVRDLIKQLRRLEQTPPELLENASLRVEFPSEITWVVRVHDQEKSMMGLKKNPIQDGGVLGLLMQRNHLRKWIYELDRVASQKRSHHDVIRPTVVSRLGEFHESSNCDVVIQYVL